MANMSYCRWQNTLRDLRDCAENLSDNDLSDEERRARNKMFDLMRDMLEERGYTIEEPEDDGEQE